jgi:hypothetical protein
MNMYSKCFILKEKLQYFMSKVREFLDIHFPGRCVDRDELIPCLPRSPDIMSLDFFLWRYLKDIICKTSMT